MIKYFFCFLCTMRSYLNTMQKQGHNLFEVLRLTFMGRAR